MYHLYDPCLSESTRTRKWNHTKFECLKRYPNWDGGRKWFGCNTSNYHVEFLKYNKIDTLSLLIYHITYTIYNVTTISIAYICHWHRTPFKLNTKHVAQNMSLIHIHIIFCCNNLKLHNNFLVVSMYLFSTLNA